MADIRNTDRYSEFFDLSRIWYFITKTGMTEHYRDDGKLVTDPFMGSIGMNYRDRFPSFASFQEFRINTIRRIKDLAERIQQGEIWEPEAFATSSMLTFTFEYPDGKNGDIDMFLAEKYGTVEFVEQTMYRVKMSTDLKNVLPLMHNYYRLMYTPTRQELIKYLECNNLNYELRSMYSELHVASLVNDSELYKSVLDIPDVYFKSITRKRNEVYTQLLNSGASSPKWASEYRLFNLVKQIYPDAVYQYRADWLNKQSLDIFIPSIGVAIEYQGIQHYEPVAVFGGEEKLQKRIELDKKKSELCKNNGIVLIEFKYNEPLDQQHIQNRINSYFTEFT